ncbi:MULTISPECIES: hypothetical protein [Parachlamydia]|jgi:uncharacterized C2H2 Zn-finger protein|uniref:Uncharacterized protein n=2 Tax=Parachlamydia acanthamoebae TaxID=83552 RepID=F8KVV0_PARAV|nr:hypothetical protein [Parachlamydia acanthamoebae]EFB42139.1 hypothetical protein pah_c014o049 [Parachlamydia acanthamoebae str. Hall's coccus]CCB85241.1 putative uncharacterized protein [Parachlamydia acanthamoebae UV-7]
MTQKGEHTWDLVVRYHQCPKCGAIIENREDFKYRLGHYEKDLECPRCHHAFTLVKNVSLKMGPFIGEGGAVEVDWKE